MQSLYSLRGVDIVADKEETLKTLKENQLTHKKIVKEARKGYMEKARKALEKRLKALEKGELVSLTFELRPPQDHSTGYETAIKMLELHQENTIKLSADQVRPFLMDRWDWTDDFLMTNSVYSATAEKLIKS